MVLDTLRAGKYAVILDHLQQPSATFASDIREITGWAATPVVGIARSAHMEDVGFLLPLFSDRQEKLELRNFENEVAEAFAQWVIGRVGLCAGNLDEFVRRVLEFSHGNPGAIISMVRMAKEPKYRSDDYIKVTPLYVDFRLGVEFGGSQEWLPRGGGTESK